MLKDLRSAQTHTTDKSFIFIMSFSLSFTFLVNPIWFKVVCVDKAKDELEKEAEDEAKLIEDDDEQVVVFDKEKHLSACSLKRFLPLKLL